MTTIALIGAFIAGLFIYNWWKTEGSKAHAPPPLENLYSLNDTQIETTWISVKHALMLTNVWEHELRFSHLNDQASRLRLKIMGRHMEYLAPSNVSQNFTRYTRTNPDNGLTGIDPTLDLPSLTKEIRLGLALYAYLGYDFPGGWKLFSGDINFSMRLVDQLIKEDFVPAIFLKGVIFKYGSALNAPPQTASAEKYLKIAAENGSNHARTELALLSMHSVLDNVMPVNSTEVTVLKPLVTHN